MFTHLRFVLGSQTRIERMRLLENGIEQTAARPLLAGQSDLFEARGRTARGDDRSKDVVERRAWIAPGRMAYDASAQFLP